MKFIVFLLVALTSQPLMAAPAPIPGFVLAYLDRSDLNYELPRGQLEPYMRSYFRRHDKAEPWSVSGDFNGDGIVDWAGFLRTPAGRIDLVAVNSIETAFSHTALASLGLDGDKLDFGVVLQPPGEISGFPLSDEDRRPTVTIDLPGIHLLYFEKASVLYYWWEGAFHEFVTSD